MVKKLVALDLLNTILNKVYTKITNETNEKIELATKGHADDTFIPLTQKAAANGVATLDANGHVPVEQIVDTTDETGNEFDYLSNIENGVDEETGKQKTRIDWRKRVAFRQPNQYIVTTEDSKEDVLVDGTKIGERVVKANVNTLMDLGTLRNYNGQWKSGEPVPADTHNFSFNSDSDPETLATGFDFLGTPVITKSEEKVYPDEAESWKKWAFVPTDSYIIYSIDGDFILEEIRDLSVEDFVEYDFARRIEVSIENTNYNSFVLSENVDYSIVSTSSIKNVTTIRGNISDDGFKNALLATGIFEEINGELHPTQTVFLYNDRLKMAFGAYARFSLSIRPGYFDVNTPQGRFSFLGDTALSAIETTPTKVNPITKLGIVDEGTWVAGDVTTPNLKVNESTVLNKTTTINNDLHITEKVLDFGGVNYDVWDYANDNMNWVEE